MFGLKLIRHREVTEKQLEEIIKIKSTAWLYNFNNQIEWMNNNFKEDDIHVLMSLNNQDVAYLNLVEIEIEIDGILKMGYGIGNVCARERGRGYGSKIMSKTNLYLKKKNKIGLLFCKYSLVGFYKLNNWKLIEKNKLELSFNNESIETMIFNYDNEFRCLKYMGKSF